MSLKNSYFCSEFISYLLVKSTIYKAYKKTGLIKPYESNKKIDNNDIVL